MGSRLGARPPGVVFRGSGAVLALALYALFEFALGIPLPDMPGLDW